VTRRTTIEIDEELVERAREILGETTPRDTVEEALRRVTEGTDHERRAANQRRYLQQLAERVDVSVLASEEMWR
jgi:Arc/MetJ family transcription regulator